MNKKPIAVVLVLVFLMVGLSGCNEQITDDKNIDDNDNADDKSFSEGMILYRSTTNNLYTIHPDGSDDVFLTTGHTASFSPDGSKIAFHRSDDKSGLYVIDVDGENEEFIVNGGLCDWSSDGNTILFLTYDWNSSTSILNSITLDDREVTEIFVGNISCASYSPDSEQITFILEERDPYNHGILYTMNADGMNQRQLIDDEISLEYRSYWDFNFYSPDGTKIAYINGGKLYVANPDGTNNLHVASATSFSWSPDGSKLAFWEYPGGLTVINQDGSDKKIVESLGSWVYSGSPRWSPDGTQLVYSVGESRSLKVRNIETDEVSVIGTGMYPSWG